MHRDSFIVFLNQHQYDAPSALETAPFDSSLEVLWDCCGTYTYDCLFVAFFYGRKVLLTRASDILESAARSLVVDVAGMRKRVAGAVKAIRDVAALMDTGADPAALETARQRAQEIALERFDLDDLSNVLQPSTLALAGALTSAAVSLAEAASTPHVTETCELVADALKRVPWDPAAGFLRPHLSPKALSNVP